MRKLTRTLTPAIAAVGMAALNPVPAMAASHEVQTSSHSRYDSRDNSRYDQRDSRSDYRGSSIRSDIAALSNRIDRAERNRTISRREAQSLSREATDLKRLYASYARNGISRSEMNTLNKRLDRLQYALRDERRDDNRRRG